MGNWEPLKHPLKPACGRPISSHETMGHGRTTYNFTWKDTFCYLFGFSLPAIGNFRDRRGRSLAYHGEPLDMLLWRRMLHQIERLKHSGKNPIPKIINFRYSTYCITAPWVGFNIFQNLHVSKCFIDFHSALLMVDIPHDWWLIYVGTPMVCHPALVSQWCQETKKQTVRLEATAVRMWGAKSPSTWGIPKSWEKPWKTKWYILYNDMTKIEWYGKACHNLESCLYQNPTTHA